MAISATFRSRVSPKRQVGGPTRLTKSKIADWARAYRRRTGQRPNPQSGPIPESPGDTWGTINTALLLGTRGLPGGSSLEQFLWGYQCSPRPRISNRDFILTHQLILEWARDFFQREGRLPHQHAGIIPNTGGLTWMAVNDFLWQGRHGLVGRTTLAKLLGKRRGSARNVHSVPLTPKLILKWADAHYRKHGTWPTDRSGAIPESPGDTWQAVMTALHSGYRGLRGGITLGQFLARHRGAPLQRRRRTPLTIPQILQWADAFHAKKGSWPIKSSGPIPDSNGEAWDNVCCALYQGSRGLPRTSLAQLLAEKRGVRNASRLPKLTWTQILKWAAEHCRRTGKWPTRRSGPIPGADGETWSCVCTALYQGLRGLGRPTSLSKLLNAREL